MRIMEQKLKLTADALCAFLIACLLFPQAGFAASTAAGTLISNTATVSFSLSGAPQPPAVSNTWSFIVDEKIYPVMQCGATTTAVNSPSLNDALPFTLTNSGNGPESFRLSRLNVLATAAAQPPQYTPINSIQYDPLNGFSGAIFIESSAGVGGSGAGAGFQAPGTLNADTLYIPGANDPTLLKDEQKTIYVLSDTPNVANGSIGSVALTATALTVGASGAVAVPVGTVLKGKGQALLGNAAGNAVVFVMNSQAVATCSYTSMGLAFAMVKTVQSVIDPQGGALLMPGSIVTYQIVLTLSGVGTATAMTVSDPLPANTRYLPNSMTLRGVAVTDSALDADGASFIPAAGVLPDTVSISLGNVVAPATVAMTLRATIN